VFGLAVMDQKLYVLRQRSDKQIYVYSADNYELSDDYITLPGFTVKVRTIGHRDGSEWTHRSDIFQPVAVENLGTTNASAYGFLAGLGQKISAISGDDSETCYLFQRISVLIQRFNATLLHESFADENRSDD